MAIVPALSFADPRVAAVAVSDSLFVGCSALSGGGFYGERPKSLFVTWSSPPGWMK